MRYLLDANVLIDASRDYYPLERVPEFWDWLIHQSKRGAVAVPVEMYDEVVAGKDDLVDWLKQHKGTLVLGDEADPALVQDVLSRGYATDLTEEEIARIGNDPFIVAYARSDPQPATVVTTEVSKPSAQRGNRRLPDVCRDLEVRCINTFDLLQKLNFRTDWSRNPAGIGAVCRGRPDGRSGRG